MSYLGLKLKTFGEPTPRALAINAIISRIQFLKSRCDGSPLDSSIKSFWMNRIITDLKRKACLFYHPFN